jgi:hypothetical protein
VVLTVFAPADSPTSLKGAGEAPSRELDETDLRRHHYVGDVEFTDGVERVHPTPC